MSTPRPLSRGLRPMVALIAALLLLAMLAPSSLAAGDPVTECAPQGVVGKIDDIDSGEPYVVGDVLSSGGLSIEVTSIKDGGEITGATWSSTTTVTKVVLQAGNDGGTTNYPAGATSGSLSSTQGFSHVTFCYLAPAADLTVAKVLTGAAKPASGTDFSFTVVCGGDTETFDRSETDGAWSWNTHGTDPDLVAGTSCTVTEAAAAGATTTAAYEGASYTPGASQTLAAGTTTNDFVFTNDYPAGQPQPAGLTVTKRVTGNDQPATTTAYGFTLVCDGDTETFTLTEDAVYTWNPAVTGTALDEDSVCTLRETQKNGATGVTATFDAASYDVDTATPANADLAAGPNAFVVTNAFDTTITRLPDPDPDPDPVVVLAPGISLDKSADDDRYTVGETVTYTYVITNTGEATLATVDLHDDVLGDLTGLLGTRTLAPGESTTVTATQVLTEDHVGSLTNVAVASGLPGRAAIVTQGLAGGHAGRPADAVVALALPAEGGRVFATDEVTVDVAAVLGIVIDKPEPAPVTDPAPVEAPIEPAPEVAAEELPRTGLDSGQLALLAFAMLLLGGLLLRRPEWE